MRRSGAAISICLLLLCSGCVDPGDGAQTPEQTVPDATEEDEGSGSEMLDGADGPAEAEDLDGSGAAEDPEQPEGSEETDGTGQAAGEPCDAAAADGVAASISGQLEAFAADDFERALGFASTGFQSGIDVAAFQDLIETQFPTVADPASHAVELCVLVDPGVAQVRVEVTGDDGARSIMGYVLIEQDERWAIEAATELSRAAGQVA